MIFKILLYWNTEVQQETSWCNEAIWNIKFIGIFYACNACNMSMLLFSHLKTFVYWEQYVKWNRNLPLCLSLFLSLCVSPWICDLYEISIRFSAYSHFMRKLMILDFFPFYPSTLLLCHSFVLINFRQQWTFDFEHFGFMPLLKQSQNNKPNQNIYAIFGWMLLFLSLVSFFFIIIITVCTGLWSRTLRPQNLKYCK